MLIKIIEIADISFEDNILQMIDVQSDNVEMDDNAVDESEGNAHQEYYGSLYSVGDDVMNEDISTDEVKAGALLYLRYEHFLSFEALEFVSCAMDDFVDRNNSKLKVTSYIKVCLDKCLLSSCNYSDNHGKRVRRFT